MYAECIVIVSVDTVDAKHNANGWNLQRAAAMKDKIRLRIRWKICLLLLLLCKWIEIRSNENKINIWITKWVKNDEKRIQYSVQSTWCTHRSSSSSSLCRAWYVCVLWPFVFRSFCAWLCVQMRHALGPMRMKINLYEIRNRLQNPGLNSIRNLCVRCRAVWILRLASYSINAAVCALVKSMSVARMGWREMSEREREVEWITQSYCCNHNSVFYVLIKRNEHEVPDTHNVYEMRACPQWSSLFSSSFIMNMGDATRQHTGRKTYNSLEYSLMRNLNVWWTHSVLCQPIQLAWDSHWVCVSMAYTLYSDSNIFE